MNSPDDTSIFAILSFDEHSIPVRVRSLTSFDARIAGEGVPAAGTEIVLKRGRLNTAGSVAWMSNGEAGLNFRWPIDDLVWLQRWPDQAHNDGLVVGLAQFPHDARLGAAARAPNSLTDAVEELRRLKRDVEKLGDSLIRDIILVATHPEIQFLDEAMQRLEKIAQTLIRLGASE